MTKEKLEKEAIQYAVDYPTSYGKGYKHKDLRIAYLAGAEPREKQIAELKRDKQNLRADLRTARNNLQAKDTAYQLAMEELNYAKTHCLFHSDCPIQKENAKLKKENL